jgi:lysophospholipase L1-like esterase
MDACLIAVQLAVNCMTTGSEPIAPDLPTSGRVTVSTSTPMASSPTKMTSTPETKPQPLIRVGGLQPTPITPLQPGAKGSMAVQLNRVQSLPAQPGQPYQVGAPQLSRMTPPQALSQPYWATYPRPQNGSQMYQFRLASLRAGQLFTRVSPQRYQQDWQQPLISPSHEDWRALLQQEAAVLARAQGGNRLSIIVGDSLGLWLPAEPLPHDRFWLNQSISGETTSQMLSRLHYFSQTRPQTIHIMAGINDLKNGASDVQVMDNFQQILSRLHRQHPQAEIVVYSILPTRWDNLPSDRISHLNQGLGRLARYQGARFVDLQPSFADVQGQLRQELTTDGLHLTITGYNLWRAALVSYSR